MAHAGTLVSSRICYPDREIVALLPNYRSGDALLLRTYPGAVWASGLWELQAASADGIIVVLDPQPGVHDHQMEFLRRLKRIVELTSFEPSNKAISFQLNKSDRFPAANAAEFVKEFGSTSERSFTSCATEGSGVVEALDSCLAQVATARSRRAGGLERDVALGLYDWSAFKSGAA